jgi:hypothetical protein
MPLVTSFGRNKKKGVELSLTVSVLVRCPSLISFVNEKENMLRINREGVASNAVVPLRLRSDRSLLFPQRLGIMNAAVHK